MLCKVQVFRMQSTTNISWFWHVYYFTTCILLHKQFLVHLGLLQGSILVSCLSVGYSVGFIQQCFLCESYVMYFLTLLSFVIFLNYFCCYHDSDHIPKLPGYRFRSLLTILWPGTLWTLEQWIASVVRIQAQRSSCRTWYISLRCWCSQDCTVLQIRSQQYHYL